MSVKVFYHAFCADGLAAAWAAWKKFGDAGKYIPIGYETKLDTGPLHGDDVYAVDFSFKPDVMEELIKVSKSVTIIDHHKTAQENIPVYQKHLRPNGDKLIFDMTKCGAMLTWEYFFPGTPAPRLLHYVQDRDLWQWALPSSAEVSAWMRNQDWSDPRKFDAYVDECETGFPGVVNIGKHLLVQTDKHVERICYTATQTKFEGLDCWIVQTPILMSEVGSHLLMDKKCQMAIIWYDDKDKMKISLRGDGKVDVSAIAKKYGGGGHKSAAGFELPVGSTLYGEEAPISKMGANEEMVNYFNQHPLKKQEALKMLLKLMHEP